jgi:hypothetical protein
VEFERQGLSSVLVVTEAFQDVARFQAAALGHRDLKHIVVPHPIGGRPVTEVREIGRTVVTELIQRMSGGG